jgi:radical SAM superfamily enzyme YgiQ (UPF0313 family)
MEIPDDIMDEMGNYPPLGLVFLATFVKQRCRYPVDVKLVDCVAERMNDNDIEIVIRDYSPDMVAITTFTPNIVDALLACDITKKVNPNIKTFLGGHHTDSYPEETLSLPNVDMICRGEGEETMLKVVETIIEGKEFNGIPGFGYIKDGKPVIDMSLPYIADLDAIPLPDRSLIKNNLYASILGADQNMATVISSRGCPNLCTYCYCPTKRYRARSIDSLMSELREIRNSGIREVYFFDDLFNITAQRVIDLSEAMLDEGIDLKWSFRGRVNAVSEEMMIIAKKAGCDRIHYGIETSDERRLKIIKKKTTIDMVRKAVALTRKHGITVIGNFMVGLPGETREDIYTTLRFMKNLNLDYSEIGVLIPFPNTELYRDGLERGILKTDYWKEFATDPNGVLSGFRPQVWTEILSQEELFKLAQKGFNQFYMRPTYILKRLLKTRSPKEFFSMAKGGLVLLRQMINGK